MYNDGTYYSGDPLRKSVKEGIVLGLTAARLLQGADLSRRVKKGKPIKAATAAIIAVDLLDGVLARKLDSDGPRRRIADSVVDSGIIAAALAAMHKKHPKARPFIGALAARELFVAGGWALDLAKSRQAKKGDVFHKLPPLTIAAFGVAAHHGSERTMKRTGAVAVGVNALLAYDYFKGWTDPSRTRTLDNGVQEVAGFYDARAAIYRMGSTLPQLEAGSPPELGPAADGEVIDSTCVEVPFDE